jgi:PKHD-type hydroxylase
MNDFLIREILSKEEVAQARELINLANEKDFWIDGLKTNRGSNKDVKSNLELDDSCCVSKINSLVMTSLDRDLQFFNFTIPKISSVNIISKTAPGGYYKPHLDSYEVGDYSTTVFLNEPEEYEGGELCLYVGNEEKKVKLDAGWGITYTTGTLHRVNTVTKGDRYVSVFWTTSFVKDPFYRSICTQLKQVKETLAEDERYNGEILETCEDTVDNPYFVIDNLFNQIMRNHGSL